MKCLVTGATGFIGSRLVETLTARGFQVNVLVRSPEKIAAPGRNKVHIFQGDVMDPKAIDKAVNNCTAVFHLAAFAGIWNKDKMLPYKINVTGTKNILDASLRHDVQKIVFTSSAGTLAPSVDSERVNEDSPLPAGYHTDYERSKLQAEQLCMDYASRGMDVVIVNPTRVFGPGPLNKSNSVTVLIKRYLTGRWRFVPGTGEYVGNYAFVDDVVNGHILAMQSGLPGEKYILGGTNVSFNAFFSHLAESSGKRFRLLHIPFPLITALSEIELFLAESTGKKPLITPPWAKRYRENRLVSSRKAIEFLKYEITPLPVALEKTIQWLLSAG